MQFYVPPAKLLTSVCHFFCLCTLHCQQVKYGNEIVQQFSRGVDIQISKLARNIVVSE
jgi:hypothetical protein